MWTIIVGNCVKTAGDVTTTADSNDKLPSKGIKVNSTRKESMGGVVALSIPDDTSSRTWRDLDDALSYRQYIRNACSFVC